MMSIDKYRYVARKWLFDRIFPRGRQYVTGQKLPAGYQNYRSGERNIRIVTKIPAQNVQGIVILAHPYLADASHFFLAHGHVFLYEKLNYQVILFDFNGFGESPFYDFNFDLDILDVYRWTRSINPELPVFLHGISFGASQIVRFLKNHDTTVNAAIIENCLDKSIHYFKARNKKIYRFLRVMGRIRPSIREEGDFVEIIRHARNIRKLAFIYGKEDSLTTIEMGKKLQYNSPVPYEVLLYEGKHLKAIEEYLAYENFLGQFLTR